MRKKECYIQDYIQKHPKISPQELDLEGNYVEKWSG
nr:MAG TPA: hypothetical protein [Caudoviricetes sp.]